MKNTFILIVAVGFVSCLHIAWAEDKRPDGLEFIEEFIENEEAAISGRNKSQDLLSQKPQILELRENEKQLLLENEKKKDALAQKINERKYLEAKKQEAMMDITKRLEQAPFGLYWDASKEDIESIGFILKPSKRENYEGVYRIENPKQKHTVFEHIFAIFGRQNHLWCIYAQGVPQEDKPDASQILKVYHQYYEALQKKYGNGKEIFSPYVYVEEKVEGEGSNKKVSHIKHQNPLGGKNFLNELQTKKASLYATFENEKLGVILGVFANGKQKSFIAIDYKNLNIMSQEKESNLEEIMDDL